MTGTLTVVGTGIMFPNQMTFEASDVIKSADEVFYNVGLHPLAVAWLQENARHSTDLYQYYDDGKDRHESYAEMVTAITEAVFAGREVAAVFYGHPGVFVGPGFDAIELCRERGYRAVMLPGVSAVDCMFADLEFDPARAGCFMVEASDFLLRAKPLVTSVPVVLWQAGVVGDMTFSKTGTSEHGDLLIERLLEYYDEDHPVISYTAPTLPGMKPEVEQGTIGGLSKMLIHASCTLLIPPAQGAKVNREMLSRLRERLPAA